MHGPDLLALIVAAHGREHGSQAWFARRVGVNDRTVRKWIAEERPVPGWVEREAQVLAGGVQLALHPADRRRWEDAAERDGYGAGALERWIIDACERAAAPR
jgi:hypothetical protein